MLNQILHFLKFVVCTLENGITLNFSPTNLVPCIFYFCLLSFSLSLIVNWFLHNSQIFDNEQFKGILQKGIDYEPTELNGALSRPFC
jgi:hypothetical protein